MPFNRAMLKKILFIAFLISSAGLMAACSSYPSASTNSPNRNVVAVVPTPPVPADNSSSNTVSDTNNIAQQQRIIIKNATLSMTVDDPNKTVSQVTALAEGAGGWIVASNVVAGGSNGTTATISVRVPADKLTTVVDQIKANAISVDNETISGEDITQKYVDLNSQLTNLQNTASQLQKIMTSTTNVADVLNVQSQLTTTQGQIEQIKGQLQYYSQAAAYSLIDLTLIQKQIPTTATPQATTLGLANWQPGQTVHDAVDALVSLVQGTILFLIWLLIIGSPIALVILIAFLIWRRLLKVRFVRKAQVSYPAATSDVPEDPA